MISFDAYRGLVTTLSFGKRLPTAVYVLHDGTANLGLRLEDLISGLRTKFEIGAEFNVLELRTDEFKISFLAYPRFLTDAHPALAMSVAVDLIAGKCRRIDYRDNPNPPILHRKELFLPESHPKRIWLNCTGRPARSPF